MTFIVQVWSNGKSIWSVGGVMFRGAGLDASVVRGLMVQCFFGGKSLFRYRALFALLWGGGVPCSLGSGG
jgi:hypothetical protein